MHSGLTCGFGQNCESHLRTSIFQCEEEREVCARITPFRGYLSSVRTTIKCSVLPSPLERLPFGDSSEMNPSLFLKDITTL